MSVSGQSLGPANSFALRGISADHAFWKPMRRSPQSGIYANSLRPLLPPLFCHAIQNLLPSTDLRGSFMGFYDVAGQAGSSLKARARGYHSDPRPRIAVPGRLSAGASLLALAWSTDSLLDRDDSGLYQQKARSARAMCQPAGGSPRRCEVIHAICLPTAGACACAFLLCGAAVMAGPPFRHCWMASARGADDVNRPNGRAEARRTNSDKI